MNREYAGKCTVEVVLSYTWMGCRYSALEDSHDKFWISQFLNNVTGSHQSSQRKHPHQSFIQSFQRLKYGQGTISGNF